MAQFNAPEDDVKSLIGDRKKRIFVPVNPDVSVLMGSASVPGNIRTEYAAGNLLVSARTVTEAPVAAVDNIAPGGGHRRFRRRRRRGCAAVDAFRR